MQPYPAFKWYHFQRPWVTSNPLFKVTPISDAGYLRDGTRYRHNFNEILIGTYTCPTQGCHFEWLSETFNDTKHRVVCLRQLSCLFTVQCLVFKVESYFLLNISLSKKQPYMQKKYNRNDTDATINFKYQNSVHADTYSSGYTYSTTIN